jgi:hypothetical protein
LDRQAASHVAAESHGADKVFRKNRGSACSPSREEFAVTPKQATVNAWLVRVALAAVVAFVIALGKPPPAAFALDTDGDGIPDATDNCVSIYNPGQENADNQIGNGAGIPGHDGTVPNSAGDLEGDACETDGDIDNDGILDGSDADPGGDITYDDNANGNPCMPLGTDAADDGPSWDADCDGVMDGAESGCPVTPNPNADADGDGLKNTWEVCKWGTNPNVVDSDGDGKGDCKEAADVNGDGVVNLAGDVMSYAKAAFFPPAAFGKDGDFDINGDGIVDYVSDVIPEAKLALISGLCK